MSAEDWRGQDELWQRLVDGDPVARSQLVEQNLRLVYWLAGRFAGRGLDRDDLCQAGALGLMKAVDNFQPDRGTQFSTYAVPMILGEIRRAIRGNTSLHITRTLREKQTQLAAARLALGSELGREPTLHELARELNISNAELAEVLASGEKPLSLQGVAGESVRQEPACADSDDDWTERIALSEGLRRLPARLAYILRARYIAEETQTAVAGRLGVSQVQVSRLEKQALARLRSYL